MATATQDTATHRKPDLSVNFAGISFKNPVIAAGGTFGYGIEFEDIVTWKSSAALSPRGSRASPWSATRRRACLRPPRAC